jgi:hypothetical protein
MTFMMARGAGRGGGGRAPLGASVRGFFIISAGGGSGGGGGAGGAAAVTASGRPKRTACGTQSVLQIGGLTHDTLQLHFVVSGEVMMLVMGSSFCRFLLSKSCIN